MAMQSLNIASSAIAYAAYDEETQELQITFHRGGGSYMLQGVPQIEADRLANADSPGAYWNANMKGRY